MADFIDRKAAMNVVGLTTDAIKIDSIETKYVDAQGNDLVAVVRCKDCVHNQAPSTSGNAVCELWYGMTDAYGYCHYGERREDGNIDPYMYPCTMCEDFDGKGGCLSHGGCGERRDGETD